MAELLTAAQMRAIEQAAIASGQVTGLELMERAGRGVVEAIFAEWPELAPPPGALPRTPGYLGQDERAEGTAHHRAVVLCGPGNNGGDGFVVARLLKGWGWAVEVFLYGEPERMPPDARANYDRWRGMGEVDRADHFAPDAGGHKSSGGVRPPADLLIDAAFGTGLSRAVPESVRLIQHEHFLSERWFRRVVSIDIPSGLCADSGEPIIPEQYPAQMRWPAADGYTLEAALTVTFHRKKLGHVLARGQQYCGKVVVKEIGLGATSDRQAVTEAKVCPRSLVKGRADHKYAHGHALILCGASSQGGAARLSARGALRIGAGVVTVGCPPDAMPENAARLDAVMLRAVADSVALRGVLEDGRINALCLGPGMGISAREARLLAVALGVSPNAFPPPAPPHRGEGSRQGLSSRAGDGGEALPLPLVGRGEARGGPSGERRSIVLDADALTILARHPDLFAALHGACVLTPHAGEFARLFPDIAARLAAPATRGPAYSKVDATREAAARAGCAVLFKGPDTVIADPSGRCAINSAAYDRAAPWLATAGSGDVLAGFIAGLLARGFSPFDAACTGAWLHVECALSFGPGLIAEDLPEELPKVFRALNL